MVETDGSSAQHQVRQEGDQQGQDGVSRTPVSLSADQFQQLMAPRENDSRSLRDRHGERVIYTDMGKNIPMLSKSATHLERTQWLTDVEDLSRSNGSGIRIWLENGFLVLRGANGGASWHALRGALAGSAGAR